MFTNRASRGASLRVLALASAAVLIAGSLTLAGRALAETTTQSASPSAARINPIFRNDRLSVEVVGTGPDVVLIPGYASSREVWRELAEALSATHRVHLVQFAGFAGEPWTHGDGAFLQPAVDAVAAYITDAGLDRPAVIGHSMGGLSALMLAQDRPESVGRVMSVDSLPFFSALFGPQATPETARPFANQASQAILTQDDDVFRRGQAQGAIGYSRNAQTRAALVEWSMASDHQALAVAIHDVMLTDRRPQLAAMTTPVWAVYASDADGGAPAAMADAMWSQEYASLSGVRLIRVDDSRHFIMADQPQRFLEIVRAFLSE